MEVVNKETMTDFAQNLGVELYQEFTCKHGPWSDEILKYRLSEHGLELFHMNDWYVTDGLENLENGIMKVDKLIKPKVSFIGKIKNILKRR
jgi:hypothetical protein